MTDRPTDPDDQPPFRSAEAWLAAQGIERDPIVVAPEPTAPEPTSADPAGPDPRTPVHAREAVRLATEAPAGEASAPAVPDGPDAGRGPLEDEVRKAVATAQRITTQAPQSEARLRRKLAKRELPQIVIDLALERCRSLGVVDDLAMASSLAQEKRRKGHAPARVAKDLADRGFTRETIDQVLAGSEREDPEAAAFAAGRQRAERLRTVDPETAFRRLVGYLTRRGYPEGLCRKVAREVVYADREQQRVAER